MAAAGDEKSVYDRFVADFTAAGAPTDKHFDEKSAKDITKAQWDLAIAYAQPRLNVYGTLAKVARVRIHQLHGHDGCREDDSRVLKLLHLYPPLFTGFLFLGRAPYFL
jgi:hypothetical protein